MRFFKKIVIVFLLVFSGQQVLAEGVYTKDKMVDFYYELGKEMTKYIDLIEEIDSEATKDKDLIIFVEQIDKEIEKIMFKKGEKLVNKFVNAATDLKQTNLIHHFQKLEKLGLDRSNNVKVLKEFTIELDEMIDEIKPQNEKEIEKIQDLRNLSDFYKKMIKIGEFLLELQEKYKKYNFFNPKFVNRN